MKCSEEAHYTAIDVIRGLFPNATEDEIQQKSQELLNVAYSIAADYSENTLTKVATAYYKIETDDYKTINQNDNSVFC